VSFNKSQKAINVNRQRQHSNEPAPKRQATSGTASCRTSAESAPLSDSLTNKLTERTSTIINNVLSGKDNTDAKNHAKAAVDQPKRASNTSQPSSGGGQSKRQDRLPLVDKPKTADKGSEKLFDASRAKGLTSLSHVSNNSQSKHRDPLPSDKSKNTDKRLDKSNSKDSSKDHGSSHVSSSQSKRPEPMSDKPKNTAREKGSTSSRCVSRESIAPASKGQPARVSTPSSPDALLSPTSRSATDIQASLVRMATAPRSRREQLELERMLQEHAKKLSTAKERMHDLQPRASGSGESARTDSAQNKLQPNQADVGQRSQESNSTNSMQEVVEIEDSRDSHSATIQEDGPSLNTAVQSAAASTTGPRKAAKNPRAGNVKNKPRKMPKVKTATAKVTKNQASKKRMSRSFVSKRLRQLNPTQFVLPANSNAARPTGMRSQLDLSMLTGLGSYSLMPNFIPGLVGTANQQVLSSPASRMTSSLPATPLLSQAAERGPLDTLLQMSLHEESLCGRLNQCSSEIEQLQKAIAKFDEELQKRIQMKTTVSSLCCLAYASYNFFYVNKNEIFSRSRCLV